MNTLQLRELRAKKWEGAKAFLDSARAENGILSAEDDAAYARMEQEIMDLGKEIERQERLEALDAQLARPVSAPIVEVPTTGTAAAKVKTGRASDEYRENFWNMMRAKVQDPHVINGLVEGTDAEGGYLVPDEYEHTLIQALEDENIFRGMAHIIRTSSGDRKIPMVVDKGSAVWLDETDAYTESDDTFGQITIGAHKLGTMIKISDELLQDSMFDMEGYIAKEFGRRMGAAEEEAFFTGDGSGKPLGVLDATTGAETGVTAAGQDTIKADELFDLYHSLRAPYRKNAVWVVNDTTVALIRKLKDGNGQYLWQPGLTVGASDQILGRPVKTSTFMPAAEAGARSVLFGEFSYYWIADRAGRSFKRLNELFATTGQVGFLSSQRVDGRVVLREAFKVLQQKA